MSGEKYAVLVGVSDYEKLAKLECGGDDAAAVRDALIRSEFDPSNIYLLADRGEASHDATVDRYDGAQGRPTKEDIDEVLEEFATRELDPDDTVLFFFSGHGVRDHGDYLVPRAANLKITAKSCLKITDIVKTLLRSGSRQIILLLDACRDEFKPKGLGVGLEIEEYVSTLEKTKGVGILFSCQREAKSFIVEDGGRHWSAFTRGLVDAIDSPDHVNLSEVEAFLTPFLQTYNLDHRVPVQKPYLIHNPHSIATLPLFGSPGIATEIEALIGEELLRLEIEEGLTIADELLDFLDSPGWHSHDTISSAKRKRIEQLYEHKMTVARFLDVWKKVLRIEARRNDPETTHVTGPRVIAEENGG